MKKYALWIVVTLTVIACVYAYFAFLKPLDVFLWDESHHGYYGMQIFNDLRAADFGAFWTHTNNQAMWMPLHSWFDGIFLLIFGFSYDSARLSSLFLFFVSSILIYFIGLELSREKGWLIGLIASALFLSSPMMLHLATVNMQEMLGIFVCLSIVYFTLHNMDRENPWKYLIIGFLLSVAYWTKNNYAAQTILGMAFFQLSELDFIWRGNKYAPSEAKEQPSKMIKNTKNASRNSKNVLFGMMIKAYKTKPAIRWIAGNMLIIIGFLPLFIFWWSMPPFERKYSLGFLLWKGFPGQVWFFPDIGILGRAIFYAQSFVSSYCFSLWLGLFCFISIIYSFYYFTDRKIRVILFFILSVYLSMLNVVNIQERYVSLTFPLAFILAANLSVILIERAIKLKKTKKIGVLIVILIMLFLVLGDSFSLTRYTKEVANRSILFFIYKDSLNKYSPPFLFGLMKRPSFTYPMDQTKKYNDFKVQPKSSIRDILEYFSANVEKGKSISTMISYAELSPYIIYWHFQNWGAPVMSVNDLGVNPRYFWLSDYFIDLEPSEDSPYYSDWLEKRWNEVGRVLLREGAIKLTAEKEFTDLGLTAKIYKR